ncbi:MotE family protein [Aminobacter anthyllidis]|uniref:MotE family protein n=2 Tax=Aminobacter anthyllidis TaxID=1035067 RepID=A0A9X1AFP2_9HYPH|nr:MotE family protein [Aminobacter anthyllidis]MBT1158788.1 MotE family protein [Aminobacter anthyllidis]MDH4988245.1 MotE family protein [Aminobacter anthyllidis]
MAMTSTLSHFRLQALAAAALAVVLTGSAYAEQAAPKTPLVQGKPTRVIEREVPAAPVEVAPVTPPVEQSEVERFCSNIADAARDRRYQLQAEELKKLQAEVDKRIALLEERKTEYETWLKRREVFLARAEEGVVQIYARMKPDAAAERLAVMNVDLAAAILMKLDARKSSVILNEMESKAAAELTRIIASAARREDPT